MGGRHEEETRRRRERGVRGVKEEMKGTRGRGGGIREM